ncbi:hypothetical protein LINPERPRIM_LOCUS29240 [Linum perenne]
MFPSFIFIEKQTTLQTYWPAGDMSSRWVLIFFLFLITI